jgi:hypothetical protein
MAAAQHVVLPTFGNGGADELSRHIDDAAPSWALLRHQVGTGAAASERIVRVAIHGADMPAVEHEKAQSLSLRILPMLGVADVTLQLQRGQELNEALSAALDSNRFDEGCLQRSSAGQARNTVRCDLSADDAVKDVGNDLASYNWALIEPTNLELFKAGFGGLEELKDWLPADRVMFGVLRFSFPRDYYAAPIVKHLFIHWIGKRVSPVRRGQWNSKLDQAVSNMRRTCDLTFRKTAYALEDLELSELISELARVTCATSSDTRQLSVDWYLEGLQVSRQAEADQPPVPKHGRQNTSASRIEETHHTSPSESVIFMPESAKRAISKVREGGCHWQWIHLKIAEGMTPFSGGA